MFIEPAGKREASSVRNAMSTFRPDGAWCLFDARYYKHYVPTGLLSGSSYTAGIHESLSSLNCSIHGSEFTEQALPARPGFVVRFLIRRFVGVGCGPGFA